MLACLLLLAATVLGMAAALGLRIPIGPFTRLGIAVALGQVPCCWTPLLISAAFDVPAATAGLAATLLLGAGAAATLAHPGGRRLMVAHLRALSGAASARDHRPLLIVGASWCALLAYLMHTHYLRPAADGLHAAGVTWGDLPIHLGLVARFAASDGFAPLAHPLYLGAPLTYPFVPDHSTAVLTALGLPLRWAFILPGLLTLAALLPLLHGLCRLWLDSRDDLPSLLTLLLFPLAGGAGFAIVFGKLFEGAEPFALLASTNATYIAPHVLKSGHVGNLFIAARTAIWGMTLGVALLLLLGHALHAQRSPRPALVAAGVLAGALPLMHAHSFLVACGAALCYTLLWRGRGWLAFWLPLLACALPQVGWLVGAGGEGYLRVDPGFLRPAPSAGQWALDLTMGMGPWLLAIPAALLVTPRRALLLGGPLLLLLPIANLITFTPAVYDNVKLLAWFDVAAAIFVAAMVARLLRAGGATRVVLGTLVVLACTASGVLAVGHELVNDALVISKADLRLARQVRDSTPPSAVIATAATYHDPVAMFSGRRVLVAAPEMLDTHGIDVRARATELVGLYAGAPFADDVIARLHVDAVLVGPRERRVMPRIDEHFLASRAAAVLQLQDHRLYLLSPP
ncbi:MAG: hypothetical protein PVI30_01645 [Myxococcales bacterium]|jgi:hypothetical protein